MNKGSVSTSNKKSGCARGMFTWKRCVLTIILDGTMTRHLFSKGSDVGIVGESTDVKVIAQHSLAVRTKGQQRPQTVIYMRLITNLIAQNGLRGKHN
jgi:hypothetical protein